MSVAHSHDFKLFLLIINDVADLEIVCDFICFHVECVFEFWNILV